MVEKWELHFLERVHDETIKCLCGLRFDKRLHRDGLLVALHASLIERSGAILLLARNGASYGIASLFRSVLENYVEFQNLSSDPSYINFILFRHHSEWSKLLNNAANNPFLGLLSATGRDKSALRIHQLKLEELKQKGYRKLSAEDRFKRAGLEHEYRSIYALESSEIHSDLSNLIRGHLSVEDEEIEVHLYRRRPPEEFEAALWSTSKLLLLASIALHDRLGSKDKERLLALLAEYDNRASTGLQE